MINTQVLFSFASSSCALLAYFLSMRGCAKDQTQEPSLSTEKNSTLRMGSCSTKSLLSQKLENIDENSPAPWLPAVSSCAAPETPTEPMEFLARSWSLSAMELSKALSNTSNVALDILETGEEQDYTCSAASKESSILQQFPSGCSNSPPISPRDSEEMKELFLLHQALNPEFLSSQQLLKNGLYKSILKGRTMGRWLKDQKERKKQEIRTQNAQQHAAVSVAGVAAAVAALAASNAMSAEMAATNHKTPPKISAAMASAAALVASHCIEIAEEMGADHDQILTVVNSAINARTNGDIMTLTAGAATALRGAATLRARLQKGCGTTAIALGEEKGEEEKEANMSAALNFVTRGGELLKRTRKGALHWKQVSFNINSNWQVAAKMKSKHMAGTFTKKKKCVVSGVISDILAWPGRESEEGGEHRAYFGIKTSERIIEFECRNKADKQMWTDGIQYMLNCISN